MVPLVSAKPGWGVDACHELAQMRQLGTRCLVRAALHQALQALVGEDIGLGMLHSTGQALCLQGAPADDVLLERPR
eukprot:5032499-Alexandrium_andersonii.AAC.1